MFCSLIRSIDQVVAPGDYVIVRFPFGVQESFDKSAMHQAKQPDGYEITAWDTDPRSGLIWPRVRGLCHLYATMQWESGNYTELRHQFIRDPLGLSTGPDTTGTEHRAPTPGMQCYTTSWQGLVNPGTPIAYRVAHNASSSRKLVHAQFKMSIDTDLIE